jgi:hypothetical protein
MVVVVAASRLVGLFVVFRVDLVKSLLLELRSAFYFTVDVGMFVSKFKSCEQGPQ